MKAQLDKFADNILELEKFFPIQWEETIFSDAKEKLNPDLNTYIEFENNGFLIFVSLKEENKLIGYFVGFKTKYPHSKDEYYVTQDSIFVHPDYRRKNGGVLLIKKLEEECKKLGVIRIILGMRTSNDISKLFERLKYKPAECLYSKYIGN